VISGFVGARNVRNVFGGTCGGSVSDRASEASELQHTVEDMDGYFKGRHNEFRAAQWAPKSGNSIARSRAPSGVSSLEVARNGLVSDRSEARSVIRDTSPRRTGPITPRRKSHEGVRAGADDRRLARRLSLDAEPRSGHGRKP
jgi:hypothetical protein